MTVKETLAMRAMTARALLAEAKYEALDKAVVNALQGYVDGVPAADNTFALQMDELRIANATELSEFCSDTELCGAVMDPNADKCLECGQPRREA